MVLLSAPVDSVPCVPLVPLHPPDAVHVVASVEVQLSVALPFAVTLSGLALSSTVGNGGGGEAFTVTWALRVTLPPAPVHCNV